MSKRKRTRERAAGRPAATAVDGMRRDAPVSVPPIDRREQRARERDERERAAARQRRRRVALRWFVGTAAAVGLVAAALLAAGFGLPEYGRSAPSEGGVGAHIASGAPLPQRNRPPTSGPHYGERASYGIFAEPVEAGAWVHALEHGAIVVAFRCTTPDECGAVADDLERTVYQPAPVGRFGERKIVGTPYREMESPFAVLAWGRILELETLDATQMLTFYERYVDRGPESAR